MHLRYMRSKSMSRIDDLRERHKMMALNAEILDAIRNRKYSLRHTPDPVVSNNRGDRGKFGKYEN